MSSEIKVCCVISMIGVASVCFAQTHEVLCSDGSGSFETEFRTGVRVSVRPQQEGGFSTRSCQGTLSWGKQTIAVANGVSRLDVDVLGTELNPGEPVVAFSETQPNLNCCMTYKIFSLKTPPRLLRTITGGGYFSAADTNLDGEVEIWTEDSAAVNAFEGLSDGEITFIPTYVLRMDHGRLLDASPEFQPFFDGVIHKVRSQAKPESLRAFKNSDGRLQLKIGTDVEQLVQLHDIRMAKVQVLEIVWAYLYSGREEQAWRVLAEMWPAEDQERIRGEILSARGRGIHSQLDGVSSPKPHKPRKAPIYLRSEVTTPAQAILMRIYPSPELGDTALGKREVHVSLVIDSAGKVREVKPLGISRKLEGLVVDSTGKVRGTEAFGDAQNLEQFVEDSVARWKFIPAFKNDRAVATSMETGVWLLK